MIALLAALALSIVPQSPVVADRCDLIEVNNCYNEDGDLIFRQLIFWDWRPEHGCFSVADYRVLGSKRPLQRQGANGRRVLVIADANTAREIEYQHWRETWTQYDPEIVDRGGFPKESRRELSDRP